MRTIKDKQRPIFATLYGGLYYDLAGIPGNTKGATDLDKLLEQLGVGDTSLKGKNAKQIFEALRSDQRTAMFRSQITGQVRRIDFFKTLAGREHQGLFSITTDFGVSDIDADQNPIANLLDVKNAKAHEIIWEKTNGVHGFMLTDANFKRQDSVPDDVAADHRMPEPHPRRLEAGFGCIRCHASGDGWRDAPNDVKTMLSTKKWDIYGDLGRKNQEDAINRIVGLYAGDLTKPFQRGRDDYAHAILSVTGPWPGSKDQTDTVRQAAKRMEWIFDAYWYRQVDAQQMLAEMGIYADEKAAPEEFARRVIDIAPKVQVESTTVTALRLGLKVSRSEVDLIYGHLMGE